MSRDNFYLLLGVVVFMSAFIILYVATDWSLFTICALAVLLSFASDILIVIDNERRNAAPDAKLHQRNELVKETATVMEDFRPQGGMYAGKIIIHGEHWRACTFEPDLHCGDQVRIIDRTGMTFTVKKTKSVAEGHGH